MAKRNTETEALDLTPAQPDQPDIQPLKSAELRAKLDNLIQERASLETERASLQTALVDAWGSSGANVAVQAVSTNETKRAAIGTVIERAEVEYQLALAEDRAAEYEALRAELQALAEQRRQITEKLVSTQQAYEAARIAADQANGNLAGYMSSATSSVDTATMPAEEITVRFGRATDAHEAAKAAHELLATAGNDLRQAETDYLAMYLEYSLKERRAHELGALTNHPYDPGAQYLPG